MQHTAKGSQDKTNDGGEDYSLRDPVARALERLKTYIENNKGFIPNSGERYRQGEWISTGLVASTVNEVISTRFCKKQQMAWIPRGSPAGSGVTLRIRVLRDFDEMERRWGIS